MFKMLKFPLFLIVLKVLVVDSFDPSKIDYCKLRCQDDSVSTACNCEPGSDRTYVTEDMGKFRQLILDTHNELRNKIARGDEKGRGYESAANMHILNYDLELEHLAKCYVMWPNFTKGHDKCRQVSYCKNDLTPGQNIAGISDPEAGSDKTIVDFIKGPKGWYEELKDVPTAEEKKKLIDEYQSTSYMIGHFTQLVWATAERIGCARAKIPKNTYDVYKFVLLCNYAGPDDECAGNLIDKPVYEVGQPCSKCGKTKCNKDLGGKYDALCGEEVKASSSDSSDSSQSSGSGNSSGPRGTDIPDIRDVSGPQDQRKDQNADKENNEIRTRDVYYIKGVDKSNRNVSNCIFVVSIIIVINNNY